MPVEIWPIEEFTYLQPARWNGTRSAERLPFLERYWQAADPDHCDGDGAESFATMLPRAEVALTRLAALPEGALAYVFSHGHFIQAVRSIVVDRELDDQARMRGFWRAGTPPAIGNAKLVRFAWNGRRWTCSDSHTLALPQRWKCGQRAELTEARRCRGPTIRHWRGIIRLPLSDLHSSTSFYRNT